MGGISCTKIMGDEAARFFVDEQRYRYGTYRRYLSLAVGEGGDILHHNNGRRCGMIIRDEQRHKICRRWGDGSHHNNGANETIIEIEGALYDAIG